MFDFLKKKIRGSSTASVARGRRKPSRPRRSRGRKLKLRQNWK